MTSYQDTEWTLVAKKDESNWIEEEERLVEFCENPVFEKLPLNNIAMTFIYIDSEQSIVGSIKTTLPLEPCENHSVMHRPGFTEKTDKAKHPKTIFSGDSVPPTWVDKTYKFDDAVIYQIAINHEHLDKKNMNLPFTRLTFSSDIAKISSSIPLFHDLYEVVVILREGELKSILKSAGKKCKTKKVRISEDAPRQYLFFKKNPGFKRTKRILERI